MKITLGKIVNPRFIEAFNRLLELPMDPKQAYWIGKTAETLQAETARFQKQQVKVLEKLGAKQEGDQWRLDGETKVDKANSELAPLIAEEIDLPLKKKIALPDGVQIRPLDLMLLSDFLTDGKPPDEKP